MCNCVAFTFICVDMFHVFLCGCFTCRISLACTFRFAGCVLPTSWPGVTISFLCRIPCGRFVLPNIVFSSTSLSLVVLWWLVLFSLFLYCFYVSHLSLRPPPLFLNVSLSVSISLALFRSRISALLGRRRIKWRFIFFVSVIMLISSIVLYVLLGSMEPSFLAFQSSSLRFLVGQWICCQCPFSPSLSSIYPLFWSW